MNKILRTLQARKAKHLEEMKALSAKASEEGRDLTAEEQTSFADLRTKVEGVNAAIERETLLERESQSLGTRGQALEVADTVRIEGGAPALVKDPKRGFRHFGEYAAKVREHYRGRATDERLQVIAAAPTTFGNEAAGADGGFAVPPEFSSTIWAYAIGEDSLIPWCDNTPVRANGMVFPKDETVPWGSDGIRAYWQAEAGAGTQTKPLLGTMTMRLHKLMALVPVTDELLEDTDALNAYIPSKAGLSIRWKANEAILFGNGNGQPQGCLNVQSTGVQPWLTVSKDSGQATATLTDTNLGNMKARLPPGSMKRALWLINNDVEGALVTLKTSGGFPLFMPFGGGQATIQAAVPNDVGQPSSPDDVMADGRIYGAPVYLSQHANTFSSLGDVNLLDMSYYRVITKAGEGIETATSMHLYFDADATAFRMIFRMDGQPKITKPITPAKGSNKMSPFLQLQAR